MQNGVLKMFVKLSLFFNKTGAYWARTPVLWNISRRLLLPDILLKSFSEKEEKEDSHENTLKKVLFYNDRDPRPKTY